MALTVALRHYVPKAPVRLHKPPLLCPLLEATFRWMPVADARMMGRECENVR